MNNFMNSNQMQTYNPMPMPTMQRWNLPHYETPLLNGRADANNFSIGPNSSILLPDANDDVVWWIRTDNMGNKNITAWDITPHQDPKPVDLNALEARLANIEEWINAKQNKSNAKQRNVSTTTATTANQSTVE